MKVVKARGEKYKYTYRRKMEKLAKPDCNHIEFVFYLEKHRYVSLVSIQGYLFFYPTYMEFICIGYQLIGCPPFSIEYSNITAVKYGRRSEEDLVLLCKDGEKIAFMVDEREMMKEKIEKLIP